jgi:ABC-type transport system substrate-binding protein
VTKPPFDNVLLRYALNMATEKQPICDFLGGGQLPAKNVVAPVPGYRAPETLIVEIDGEHYDVLKFDVQGARTLLAKSGLGSLEITYHFPQLPETGPRAEMLRQQWLHHLGIRLKLVPREFNAHWNMTVKGEYHGVADYVPADLHDQPFLVRLLTAVRPGHGVADRMRLHQNARGCRSDVELR